MQSFIIVGENKQESTDYLLTFYKNHNIDVRDQIVIDEEGSIGIAVIRSLQQGAYVKPFKGTHKALVINNAQNLTAESQNALLKLLEEPPSHLFIFLVSSTENFFLPTVLSRCKVIYLHKGSREVQPDSRFEKDLQMLTQGTIGDKLTLAETLAKDKESVRSWFIGMLLFLRNGMLSDTTNQTYPRLIATLDKAYTLFQSTNVSTRMLLEHAFLHHEI